MVIPTQLTQRLAAGEPVDPESDAERTQVIEWSAAGESESESTQVLPPVPDPPTPPRRRRGGSSRQ